MKNKSKNLVVLASCALLMGAASAVSQVKSSPVSADSNVVYTPTGWQTRSDGGAYNVFTLNFGGQLFNLSQNDWDHNGGTVTTEFLSGMSFHMKDESVLLGSDLFRTDIGSSIWGDNNIFFNFKTVELYQQVHGTMGGECPVNFIEMKIPFQTTINDITATFEADNYYIASNGAWVSDIYNAPGTVTGYGSPVIEDINFDAAPKQQVMLRMAGGETYIEIAHHSHADDNYFKNDIMNVEANADFILNKIKLGCFENVIINFKGGTSKKLSEIFGGIYRYCQWTDVANFIKISVEDPTTIQSIDVNAGAQFMYGKYIFEQETTTKFVITEFSGDGSIAFTSPLVNSSEKIGLTNINVRSDFTVDGNYNFIMLFTDANLGSENNVVINNPGNVNFIKDNLNTLSNIRIYTSVDDATGVNLTDISNGFITVKQWTDNAISLGILYNAYVNSYNGKTVYRVEIPEGTQLLSLGSKIVTVDKTYNFINLHHGVGQNNQDCSWEFANAVTLTIDGVTKYLAPGAKYSEPTLEDVSGKHFLGWFDSLGNPFSFDTPITSNTVVNSSYCDGTLEEHAANAATCENPGNSLYYSCNECGLFFSDSEGKNQIAENSWVISAKGHDWNDATYSWAGNKCTATRVCKHDANHVETETVTAVFVEDTPATCETNQTGHYEATFANTTAFTKQSTAANSVIKENTALGHDWNNPTYSWDGDKCTATRVCKHDANHVETETVTGTYVKDFDATCTANEKGHYVATFTNSAFENQESAMFDIEGTATGHSYGEPTYTWNEETHECTARVECLENDSSIEETVAATYVKDTDATTETNEKGHWEVSFEAPELGSTSTEANSYEVPDSKLPVEKKGCGSSIVAASAIVTVVSLLGAGLIASKRKEN